MDVSRTFHILKSEVCHNPGGAACSAKFSLPIRSRAEVLAELVTATCGCIECSLNGHSLGIGEFREVAETNIATINVRFSIRDKIGVQSASVIINLRDSRTRSLLQKLRLECRAHVYSDLEFNPPIINLIPVSLPEQTMTTEVALIRIARLHDLSSQGVFSTSTGGAIDMQFDDLKPESPTLLVGAGLMRQSQTIRLSIRRQERSGARPASSLFPAGLLRARFPASNAEASASLPVTIREEL